MVAPIKMWKSVLISTVLAFCTYGVEASDGRISLGSCPRTYLPPDFNISAFMGTWYLHSVYAYFSPAELKCLNLNLTYRPADHEHFKPHIEGQSRIDFQVRYGPFDIFSKWKTLNITFKFLLPEEHENPRKWITREVLDFRVFKIHADTPSWILATDYENYAILWSCLDNKLIKTNIQRTWILTRVQNFSAEDDPSTTEKLLDALRAYGYELSNFHNVNQADC